MSVSELSVNAQNYLKAIWAWQEWQQEQPLQPSQLAKYLGVRPSTVTDAVKKLTALELVHHTPYGAISLTKTGRTHALTMIRRHRLLETYLVQELEYSWDQVHSEAERLEHAVSDLMIERIAVKLGNPERDPHGDPIPTAEGAITIPAAHPLSDADIGRDVVLERINDSDPELLQYLAKHRIGIGTQLCFKQGAPFTDTLIAATAHGEIVLGRAALAKIWVSDYC